MVRYVRPSERSEDIEDRRREHTEATLAAHRRQTGEREAPAVKSGRGENLSRAKDYSLDDPRPARRPRSTKGGPFSEAAFDKAVRDMRRGK